MPFIRLSDNYIDHPKFLALSAAAFRLWHEGMAFCRKHQTDGVIPMATLRGFRYYLARLVTELETPYQPGAQPLWEPVPDVGFQVHDYLFWNLSRAEEQVEKEAATKRMRDHRRKARDAVRSPVRSGEQAGERSPNVLDRTGTGSDLLVRQERESERKPLDAPSGVIVFRGQKLTIFGWMLNVCVQTLGNHADAFDLHAWFFQLDAEALAANTVVPRRDNGDWLIGQLVAEAHRRGVPLTMAAAGVPQLGKLSTRLASALANIKREAQ